MLSEQREGHIEKEARKSPKNMNLHERINFKAKNKSIAEKFKYYLIMLPLLFKSQNQIDFEWECANDWEDNTEHREELERQRETFSPCELGTCGHKYC